MMNQIRDRRVKDFLAARLYVITDRAMARERSYADIARQVCAGGGRLIQLRDKTTPFEDLVEAGRALVAVAREYDTLVIANDNPYLAREIGADGVHLGQTDVPVEIARDILGEEAIIGLSTHNFKQVLKAQKHPLDYIAIGPVFETMSKRNPDKTVGTDAVHWAVDRSSVPVAAVGGINAQNIESVAQAGADVIAVISAVMAADDIKSATADLLGQIHEARKSL
jgi:thiamine-phosphate pyrophosphorylase